MTTSRRQWLAGAGFAAGTAAAAGLASIATQRGLDWYETIEKPAWTPPDAAFSIVWTPLYVLIAVAGWLAWRSGGGWGTTGPWATQMALNAAWSFLFFTFERPGWALVEIVALAAAIVWTMWRMWPVDRRASLLLAPYLAWVLFATTLNAAIVVLNA